MGGIDNLEGGLAAKMAAAAAEAELRQATGVDQVLGDLEQLEKMVGRMPDRAPSQP